jgi:hypothetical protein
MNLSKALLASTLLLPFASFAAAQTITDWGFEPNGELRVVVGNNPVIIAPDEDDRDEYFQALMAARFQWPVEVKNGELVIDKAAVPREELRLLACTTQTCPYDDITPTIYQCTLDTLAEYIVSDAVQGTILPPWPQGIVNGEPVDGTQRANFTLPVDPTGPFAGEYGIDVTYTSATKHLEGFIAVSPTEKYGFMWAMVDSSVKACSAKP